ncbi:5015_t:CDS:2, partial [Funneliformis geosporum]
FKNMTRYSAEELETKFKGSASIRISEKKSGNNGGRCDYGGAHNLKEDCQKLSELFANITELRNCRRELTTFNNQEEFEKNKRELLEKVNEAINNLQMRTSDINNFRKEIEMLRSDIENVSYNEAKELLKLNVEERKLQKEIEENERKARNEPDENKKKQFIFLAEDFLKAVENKLSGKNRPPRTTRTANPQQPATGFGNPSSSNPNPQSTAYGNYSPNSNNNNPEQKPFAEKY